MKPPPHKVTVRGSSNTMSNKHDATDNSFRQSVKQYIEAQQLSDEALARMEALFSAAAQADEGVSADSLFSKELQLESDAIEKPSAQDYIDETESMLASQPAASSKGRKPLVKLVYALAASVFVLVAAFQLYSYTQIQQLFNGASNSVVMTSMSWKIADEVARNHVKMKPLEVRTEQLSQLRDYFTQLDFTPVNSSFLTKANDTDSKMLGGRYCSIQGLTAAQIRFSQKDKQPITLYEVQYDPSLYGEQPILEQGDKPTELMVRGVAVSIWVEKGLLMATARSVD